MKKHLLFATIMAISLCSPANADNIGGIDMDISGGWKFMETKESENVITNYYL